MEQYALQTSRSSFNAIWSLEYRHDTNTKLKENIQRNHRGEHPPTEH